LRRLYSVGGTWASNYKTWVEKITERGKQKYLERNLIPVSYCPPQIAQRMIRNWTQASEMKDLSLTAWTMIRHLLSLVIISYWNTQHETYRSRNKEQPQYKYLKAVPQCWQTMESPAVNPQEEEAGKEKHLQFSSTWTKHPPLHHLQGDTLSQIRQHYPKKKEIVYYLEHVPSHCTQQLRPTLLRTTSRLHCTIGPSSFKAGVRNNAVWLLHAKI